MGRQKQPQIRMRLLEACTDHALAHGVPTRLEPFAVAAGSSSRMLIYHFGTRDALLREVLQHARRRQRDVFGELVRAKPGEPYTETLQHAWAAMTGPTGRPFLLAFDRLREDADQQVGPGFRPEATTDWLVPLEDGLRSIAAPELATVVLAVIRGLVMDLRATGDTARVDLAFAAFLNTLPDPSSPDPSGIGPSIPGLSIPGLGGIGLSPAALLRWCCWRRAKMEG